MIESFFFISILFAILLPLLLAGFLRRHSKVPWMFFSVGIATFTISQAIHIPLNNWLNESGLLNSPSQPGNQPLWQIALIAGFTAGVCEELVRAMGYLWIKKARKIPDGVMMGLGHGGIESMVFVGVQLAAAFGSITPFLHNTITLSQFPDLSAEQLVTIQDQINLLLAAPWEALLPLLERIIAIGIQVTLSVMVLQTFTTRKAGWLALAVAYHMAIDAFAVLSMNILENRLLIEFGLFLTALPGYIWLLLKIRNSRSFNGLNPNPIRLEIKLLFTATSKEFLQLWRTRRVLIVTAVFGLFGLTSPVLAYFMPNLMTAIPGAEAFASLIPTPTAGDAISQYHKNITQFGFLLAVILGMGMVAGEKERGTATLVLSKPLPRWAFLTSKLIAQFSLSFLGFLLAAVAGYIYTTILFGNIDFLQFFTMNLVLTAWIFPFIALTLVGSVLATSTTAAGGISLALVIFVLLISNIPMIGSLMPSALSLWAAQLGALSAGVAASTPGSIPYPNQPVPANYGALAASLCIIIVCLIVSLGFFEQQEF